MPRCLALLACAVAAPLALAACGGSSASKLGTDGQIAPVGERVAGPSLTAPYLGTGTSFSLASMKGHVVVLNVFGSWCDPCKAEQKALSSLAASMKASGVEFVGLAERDDPSGIKSFQQTYDVGYPAIDDDSGAIVAKFRALPVSAIPSTLVFDKDGREAARFIGTTPADALRSVLTSLSSEPA